MSLSYVVIISFNTGIIDACFLKKTCRVFQKMRLLNKSDKVLLEHLRIFSIDRKIEGSIHEMEINFEKSSR